MIRKQINCLLFIIFIELSAHVFATNCPKQPLFSTKTPYTFIGNNFTENNAPKNCKPIQINMVHRHGNRYPSDKDVNEMDKLLKFIQNKTFLNIAIPTKNLFKKEEDSLLNEIGEKELYEIGKRIRIRFSDLFQKRYSPLLYKFESTCKLRTVHSSNSLAAGLFENTGTLGACRIQPIAIQTYPCDSSKELEFYKMCKSYTDKVEKNEETKEEMKKFGKGTEMNNVLEKVKRKLGLSFSLEVNHLKIMYIYCSYEIGMFSGTMDTGFCSMFDNDDLQVIEYYFDLEDFYLSSKVFPITYQSSCPLLADIVKTLKTATIINSTESFNGIFRSGHSETIVPFLALLGVYLNEGYLTASNYKEMKARIFRASCLAPFSANIYFVLYKCDDDNYKIQLSVNEHLVKIPCCDSKEDCSFSKFLECYESIAEKCNYESMCTSSPSKTSNSKLIFNTWEFVSLYFTAIVSLFMAKKILI
ncbi:multiple inositol polyphosphate phosphatase 1 isoform X1 [Hydra vulgaris]